jgi:EAL domain-containing protein (putative c-di-GMP-specific phosphodiesterase class I)/ActR/RegA family two-component response regulator
MSPSAESLNCLVVDDDPSVCEFLSAAIQKMGWITHCASSRLTARGAVVDIRPDLVLLDLGLGSTDAIEVMSDLTDMRFAGGIVLISGRGHDVLDQVARVGKKMGLQLRSPLPKPFGLEQLRHALLGEEAAIGSRNRLTVRDALRNGQLELSYQPRIDLASRAIVSFEAIPKVRHPRIGLIDAQKLLTKVSRDDLWAIATFSVTSVLEDWLTISNVCNVPFALTMPACLLSGPEMVDFVRGRLPAANTWPGMTFLIPGDELLETVLASRESTLRLQLYGVDIGIDEFGLRPSSLAIPDTLICSEAVLATTIVNGAASEGVRAGLCKTALDRARACGARVIAKGLVHAEDISVVRILGAEIGQGPALSDSFAVAELMARLGQPVPS